MRISQIRQIRSDADREQCNPGIIGSLPPTPYYRQQCLIFLLLLIDKRRNHFTPGAETMVQRAVETVTGKGLKTIQRDVIGQLEQTSKS